MTRRLISLLLGVGVVTLFVIVQSLENWILVKHTTELLRETGPFGTAIAGLLMSRITPLVLALLVTAIAIEMWRARKEEMPTHVADGFTSTATVANSANSSSSAVGNSVVVNVPIPFPTLPPPTVPGEEESFAVDVEFYPFQGQSTKMFVGIKNLGRKQYFEAQCRVVAVRNTSCPLTTFNLAWECGGAAYQLKTGEWGNLLIASADEDRASHLEWMRLESFSSKILPECRWTPGAKSLPECDVEITVLGHQSDAPRTERFTVRAGKGNQALEMFRRNVLILFPSEGAEVGHRHAVNGTVSPPDAQVQVYVRPGKQDWYHQGDVVASNGTWQLNCWFGNPDTGIGGEYNIEARSNGNIVGKRFAVLPPLGTPSNFVKVKRTKN